jgi:hypothetical protein
MDQPPQANLQQAHQQIVPSPEMRIFKKKCEIECTNRYCHSETQPQALSLCQEEKSYLNFFWLYLPKVNSTFLLYESHDQRTLQR